MGEVQPSPLAAKTTRTSCVSFLPGLHRSAQHETDRGRGELGTRDNAGNCSYRPRSRPSFDEREVRELAGRIQLPGPRHSWNRRRSAFARFGAPLRAHRRDDQSASTAPGMGLRLVSRQGEPVGRDFACPPKPLARWATSLSAPQARAVHIVAHRSRPRPA